MNSFVHQSLAFIPAADLLGGKRRNAWLVWQFVVALMSVVLVLGARADEVENPKEVEGFWGTVTGEVKSAQADGRAFVLTITKAEFDPASSALKDNAPIDRQGTDHRHAHAEDAAGGELSARG